MPNVSWAKTEKKTNTFSHSEVLVSISLIQGWRAKCTLSIKILVLWPPERKQILKPKILYD